MPACGQQSHVNPFLFDYLITTHRTDKLTMKICSLTLTYDEGADLYSAEAKVESGGLYFAASARYDSPVEAAKRAANTACNNATRALIDQIEISTQVKF